MMRLDDQAYQGPERRVGKRYPLCIPVPVVPVDEQLRPLADPVVLMCRNIANGGIALMHTQPIESKFLILELSSPDGDPIQTVVEVLRCSPLGDFYEVAGKFLTTVDG